MCTTPTHQGVYQAVTTLPQTGQPVILPPMRDLATEHITLKSIFHDHKQQWHIDYYACSLLLMYCMYNATDFPFPTVHNTA